ncbi:hypothetical protein [Sinorhizobium sp. Sb3]|uniref:hypothetical protein n=1 Tax=Sinorhizobium/Ensifer group TaxID=227292 RepID=UPI000725F525|nr:hypothetical protein [Sinorhizobium sp. Sb3]KSV62745.1 hypothetical protein N183_36385 [Sinorhizobium sp. Sb3]
MSEPTISYKNQRFPIARHSSDPRDGVVECRGRRNSLRSQTKALSGLMKQRDIADRN